MESATTKDNLDHGTGETPQSSAFSSQEYWPDLVDYLVNGPDCVVLVSQNWGILEANETFTTQVTAEWTQGAHCFLDTLTSASRQELEHVFQKRGLDGNVVELQHKVSAGSRPVSYHFRSRGDRWILVGRDHSDQMEIVTQMATLVEEIDPPPPPSTESSKKPALPLEKDRLTGIPGRKEFESTVGLLRAQSAKEGKPFAVILLDVDHFRSLNDLYGHPTGDLVLQRIAGILEENLRDGDLIARTGGDEFVMVATDLDKAQTLEVADRLRAAVEKAKMPEGVRNVTISAGVAMTSPTSAEYGQDPVLFAERALTAAKSSGRNCVQLAD